MDRYFTWLLGIGIVAVVLSFVLAGLLRAARPELHAAGRYRAWHLHLRVATDLGSLAGALCERSGVVNVAIEGQLLSGAFGGALVGTIAGSAWVGLLGGIVGGVLISAMLAWFSIKYLVDQVVLGVVLNLFAIGLTGFYLRAGDAASTRSRTTSRRSFRCGRSLLSKIPVLGPSIFTGTIFLFLALILVAVITIGLFRTRWGLRTRSVGEHPEAADTVGINVYRVRYRNVLLAGVVSGLGGAFFTLALVGQFTKNMVSGRGFIALAALIFGRWHPVGALLASLFFGFADKLAGYLASISSPIPSDFLAMLPYLATILAVAGLVGRVRAPAADGKPYVKG
jgi:simple sugar transport system permease protein